MTELPKRESGLDSFLASVERRNSRGGDLRVRLMPSMGHINIRGDSNDKTFVSGVESVLGQELPANNNTMTIGSHRVYWLGPDEWLIVTKHENTRDLIAQLATATNKWHAAATDVSGGNILFRLSGNDARNVLAKGCTLDLHTEVFTAGQCAQSGLAKASVLIGHIDDQPTYEIVLRRSFSEYLFLWLRSAGQEYGIEFTVD